MKDSYIGMIIAFRLPNDIRIRRGIIVDKLPAPDRRYVVELLEDAYLNRRVHVNVDRKNIIETYTPSDKVKMHFPPFSMKYGSLSPEEVLRLHDRMVEEQPIMDEWGDHIRREISRIKEKENDKKYLNTMITRIKSEREENERNLPSRMMNEYVDRKKKNSKIKSKRKTSKNCKCRK